MATNEVAVRLLLAGDVMLGRGIDQILPHPCEPTLHEAAVSSARAYVELAERCNGAIATPVGFDYVWGDALRATAARSADARVVNLETAVTTRGTPVPKGINYRMSPANLAALQAFRVDVATLANNHVLDWGQQGLDDTLFSLDAYGFRRAGAGRSRFEAEAPAIVPLPDGRRLLVVAVSLPTSGTPLDWAAGDEAPGVAMFDRLGDDEVDAMAARVAAARQPGDVVALSIHWGANWGYDIAGSERRFARGLIDRAGIDIVFGHSSHHARAIEVHAGRPILYGCGDLVNDYEGIGGDEAYRGDLVLLYHLGLDASGALEALDLVPFRLQRFRLTTPEPADLDWLERRLGREYGRFDAGVARQGDGSFALRWT